MCGESRNASSLPGRPQWSQSEGGIAPLAENRFACTGQTGPPTVNAPLPPGPKSESEIHGGRSCLNGLSPNWRFETKVISPDSVSPGVGGTSSLPSQVENSNGHTIQLASGDQEGLVVPWSTSGPAVTTAQRRGRRHRRRDQRDRDGHRNCDRQRHDYSELRQWQRPRY